jgi:hypothetical protein
MRAPLAGLSVVELRSWRFGRARGEGKRVDASRPGKQSSRQTRRQTSGETRVEFGGLTRELQEGMVGGKVRGQTREKDSRLAGRQA